MTSARRATVFIVDDDDAVRDALTMLMRAEDLAVETFASAEAFLRKHRPVRAACLVLDVRMPGMSGLELQEHLAAMGSELPIVFLTGHGDVPMAVRAVKRGAFDFIQKPVDEERLLAAIGGALAFAAGTPPASARPLARPPGAATLSRRERQVLDLILAGRQTRAIADALFISPKTVEFHRGNIHAKLGVSSLAELFSLCLASERSRSRDATGKLG